MNKHTYESIPDLTEKNVLEILEDNDCDMAKVIVNGTVFLEGNNWDFHNGCYGHYDLPDFNSVEELKEIIIHYIEDIKGLKLEVKQGSYSYE